MTLRPQIKICTRVPRGEPAISLFSAGSDVSGLPCTEKEQSYIRKKLDAKESLVVIQSADQWLAVIRPEPADTIPAGLESFRRLAARVQPLLTAEKHRQVYIIDQGLAPGMTLAFLEGMVLSGYQFLKYFRDRQEKQHSLEECFVLSQQVSEQDLVKLERILEGVFTARNLVNEPLSYLTAVQLSREFEKLGQAGGFSVEVFNKKKIESLRMGGLLAVNRGSIDPPTFTVMEWKPEKPVNTRPFILVGKGVVYDTGGLSLKPTKDSMDSMKSDMAGAAAVGGALYALASNHIPLHVIGLVPATDNRPDGNAYTPGDVVTMYDGTTVEVLNTDAEGRMILADALSYAGKYDPELVIELSTLTGSASMAIGPYGIVGMGKGKKELFTLLQECGEEVYERVVEFPFWEEYREQLRSEIADLKNIGDREGGAISAGKFLEHFTSYPFIHLDIAGPAFLSKQIHYLKKGGTGAGVRLLARFFERLSEQGIHDQS